LWCWNPESISLSFQFFFNQFFRKSRLLRLPGHGHQQTYS
jgi:hypothetical protein